MCMYIYIYVYTHIHMFFGVNPEVGLGIVKSAQVRASDDRA